MRILNPCSLFGQWRAPSLRVTLYLTPCIVSFPPGNRCDVLINPANERLAGTRFTPGECVRHLAPGSTLLYPPQVIDGLVHGYRGDSSGGDSSGGEALRAAIARLPIVADGGVRCPLGHAVATPAFGELSECYSRIVHCVAPFYSSSDDWRSILHACYVNAFTASAVHGAKSMAIPLLGSGARGAPAMQAAEVAASAVRHWRCERKGNASPIDARFAVIDEDVAGTIAAAMDTTLSRVGVE